MFLEELEKLEEIKKIGYKNSQIKVVKLKEMEVVNMFSYCGVVISEDFKMLVRQLQVGCVRDVFYFLKKVLNLMVLQIFFGVLFYN